MTQGMYSWAQSTSWEDWAGRFSVLLTIGVAMWGLLIGSFLNVVIARVPHGESVVAPRSRCPSCGRLIVWYDNIPVFSWILLRGRCRQCKSPISWRYPLVELLTSFIFLLCLARFGFSYSLLRALVFAAFLIPLFFIDAEHWILPLELTIPGMILGVVLSWPLGYERFEGAMLGLFVGFVVFRLVEYWGFRFFQKEALGAGDKFLMAMVGAFLTHSAFLGVLLLSSVQASVFGLSRLAWERWKHRGSLVDEVETPVDTSLTEQALSFQWAFLKEGLTFRQRLLLVPYALLLQPIPDDEPLSSEEGGDEADADVWVPGPTHIPFGPWIVLAAFEILLLGPFFGSLFPFLRMSGLFFGADSVG